MRTVRELFSRMPFSLAVAAMAALASRSPAQSSAESPTWRETASRWKTRVLAQADEVQGAVRAFVDKHLGDQPPMTYMRGLYALAEENGPAPVWRALEEGQETPERVILLVHGLDEVGDLWNDLVVPLSADRRLAGAGIVRFEYPNDQAIARSADELFGALSELRLRGTRRVDLVCHSMGGLVARDVLTRAGMYDGHARGHGDRPDLTSLIMIGTPNRGSPMARLRALSQVREQVERWVASDNHNVRDLFRSCGDGDGKAGDDLMPGSEYLAALNARPLPPSAEIPITAVVGRMITPEDLHLDAALSAPVTARVLGQERAARLLDACREFSKQVGDGVVSCASAELEGAAATRELEATHRGMIRRLDVDRLAHEVFGSGPGARPPGVDVVLDSLAAAHGG